VAAGQLQTELQCTVIGESDAALRIRIAEIWEVDIYKEIILGVYRGLAAQTPSYPIKNLRKQTAFLHVISLQVMYNQILMCPQEERRLSSASSDDACW
jgi:hypothetical protein